MLNNITITAEQLKTLEKLLSCDDSLLDSCTDTLDTVDDFRKIWGGAFKTGELNGIKWAEFRDIQLRKGDRRFDATVFDFGDCRVVYK